MLSKLLEKYYLISQEIETEKQADLDRMFDSLVSSFIDTKQQEESQTDDKDWFRQHEKNIFALRCLRIAINCRLITNGYYKEKEQLDKDIEDAQKVVLHGLDNFIVSEKGGRILICKRSDEQRIKEFV